MEGRAFHADEGRGTRDVAAETRNLRDEVLALEKLARLAQRQPHDFCPAVADDAIATLQTHEWPGNIRQLRNVVEWLLIMAPGDASQPIRSENLPPDLGAAVPSALRGESGAEIMGLPLREARELFERQYLIAQVTRFGGNISRTANFVGMERSALHRKLKVLGVHGVDRERGPSLDS